MHTEDPITTSVALAESLAQHGAEQGALLPVLHALQDRLGYIPPATLPAIGKALNLSRAEVHGVVTFYPHFRQKCAGMHVIHICQAEACQAMGAAELTAHAQRSLGVELHGTTADGRYTLEPVYCLGNCACSPAMMIGDNLHGRVDAAMFDAVVAQLDAEAPAP
jgi:formate dehydrogenase subunit gamma